MDTNVWSSGDSLAIDREEERRVASRSTLMHPAIIWLARAPQEPITVRLLDYFDQGVAFICPFPIETGEIFDYCLVHHGIRRVDFHVSNCEYLCEDTFRISAHG